MTDWTQVGAIATGAGALVTGVSAGLIAWQAWETRRTAQAGRGGVEIGQRSLEVSQALAIDSTKARLDARAPRLLVTAAPTHGEVVMGPSGSGQPRPWPVDRTFRRTEDDYQYLLTGAQVDIKNEGDRSQRVGIDANEVTLLRPENGNITPNGGRITVLLAPGESCEFRLADQRTLQQWSEVWEARRGGEAAAGKTGGEVICSDPYDEGIVDRWKIELYSYPVEPILNDLAGWRIRNGQTDPPIVTTYISQQTREYYLSKQGNRKLETTSPQGDERTS
ncbi:hypothetical protein [Saccharothrix deserti]|uniref:hypothetical protein n=1 Tax=Saccharothrix deserti TaxID=2593674 RepID=UPI00131DAD8B|nr:hypothetical protein [Saccharothrix deserti]